jgi:chitosanase
MNSEINAKIKRIVSCIETDKQYNDYALISLLHDGPNKVKQVTLGCGLTQGGGDLEKCIRLYITRNGLYSKELLPYVSRISTDFSLADNQTFINLLKKASNEDKIMVQCQDDVFDELYFNPSLMFFNNGKFTTPLSLLVIYDSLTQSGCIFSFLRNAFSEKIPSNGGDEKKWISEYLRVRKNWMLSHPNSAVRASVYRINTYQMLIKNNNWNLDGPIVTTNGCKVD